MDRWGGQRPRGKLRIFRSWLDFAIQGAIGQGPGRFENVTGTPREGTRLQESGASL